MNMKKEFEIPVITVTTAEIEDVITTSTASTTNVFGIELPIHEW